MGSDEELQYFIRNHYFSVLKLIGVDKKENEFYAVRMRLPLCICFCAAALLVFSGCGRNTSSDLDREELFSLSYGRFDDEIDLFTHTAGGNSPAVCLFMRDGIFYIGNASAKKVLQFTSYGDLLSVYYNPEFVPTPDFSSALSSWETPEADVGIATQNAVEYPFNRILAVAVDSQKRLFVADTLPPERVEFNEEEQLMLENIVVRFDASGRFLDYIGQEGSAGTPFSTLAGVFVNADDELFVISRKTSGADVFCFDGGGRLLYRIPVSFDALPSPYQDGKRNISVLSEVVPSYRSGYLFFKMDGYREVLDSETGSASGIAFDRSFLYPFSIERAAFEDCVNLPVYEDDETGGSASSEAKALKPYGLLGVTGNNSVFLYTPTSRGYEICILDLESKRLQKRSLVVSYSEQVYNAFHLSGDGILSALLAGQDKAVVVWWRTDALIGEIRR